MDKMDQIKESVTTAVKNFEDELKKYSVDARKWNFSVGKENEAIVVKVELEVVIKKK